jgi:hypothetical protein
LILIKHEQITGPPKKEDRFNKAEAVSRKNPDVFISAKAMPEWLLSIL